MQLQSSEIMVKELFIWVDPVDENPQVERERCHFQSCIVHIWNGLQQAVSDIGRVDVDLLDVPF